MFKIISSAAIIFGTFAFTPAVHAEQTTTQKASVKLKQAYYTVVDKTSYTVDFKKGSSAVPQSAVNSLTALFKSLKGELEGGEIVIAGWSDREFPMSSNTKLTGTDKDLAAARIDNVKKVVKSLGLKNTIDTINLGEQNSLIEKLFQSDETQVKEAMQSGETDSRKVAGITKSLKSSGGPEKVVVLVRRMVDDNAVN